MNSRSKNQPIRKSGFNPLLFRPLVAGLGLLLFLSCAHQMSPTGGPEDKSGPYVALTTPASASVKVKQTGAIVLTFSKWITPASAQKSIAILPPLDGGFRVSVSGRRLIITPRKRFADSTTYHVVVTSALQDYHNNKLDGSYSLVFSTGPTLDSGLVAGCVNDTTRKPVQAIAGLYALRGTEVADSTPFGSPDYLTQTDSSGFFSFSNIRNGNYLLIAFVDQNNNRRLDPGLERAFAPLMQTVTISPRADTLPLYPVETDTATPRLVSARALRSESILCKWSRPLDSVRGYGEPVWSIEPADGKSGPLQVNQVLWLGARDRCVLSPAAPLLAEAYRLQATFSKRKAVIADTVRFNGTIAPDTVKPKFISSSPSKLALAPQIRLIFSKPIAINDRLALIDSLNGSVPLRCAPGFNDTITLTTETHIRPGMVYRLALLKNSCMDLAGNGLKPRDSLSDTAATISFATIQADSLAVSVKGCATCLGRDARRMWTFLPFGGSPVTCQDRGGCFEFDSIPSGKGQIEYFIDANGNKQRDRGSLVPWIAPEAFRRMPDTIEARARWEVEGVTLNSPCGRCSQAPAGTKPDSTITPRPRSPGISAQKH